MPVVPPGITPYTITAPLTTGDLGQPSESIQKDTERILDFITDERHLTAQDLLHNVLERLEAWERKQQQDKESETTGASQSQSLRRSSLLKSANRISFNKKQREKEAAEAAAKAAVDQEYIDARALLDEKRETLEILEHRCRLFRAAQKNLTEQEEWTLASTHFGISTYYRREKDETLSLKLEGEMNDIPLFEQVCVLKEVDLHYKWAPFCTSSMTIADLDKLDVVGWFMFGLSGFGLARDGCFRAIGCDNIQDDGSILLAGQGIQDVKPGAPGPEDTFLSDDPIISKLTIPPVPTRRGADRMTCRKFDAKITVTSPRAANIKLVANIDPNISFLPQSLLEFVMKQVCGILLAKLQTAAKKVVNHPVTNEHAIRMREEEPFYRQWLMAKFQAICEQKGWEMPPVNAFEVSEEELRHANKNKPNARVASTPRRAVTFSPDSSSPTKSVEYDDSDHSVVSELTSRSGRGWKPIRHFVKKREERKAKQKEQEIEEVRQLAAERIQPKEMTESQQERLAQLRDAKERRIKGVEHENGAESNGDGGRILQFPYDEMTIDQRSISEKITDRLHSHGRIKRSMVMILCISLFFLILHPEIFGTLKISSLDFSKEHSPTGFWIELVRSVGFLFYLLLVAILHFASCDIALVYAFDALELGSKTGQEVKKYYSDKVRIVIAIMSFGIYSLSVSNSLLRVAASLVLSFRPTDTLNTLAEGAVESLEAFPGANDTTATLYTLVETASPLLDQAASHFTVPSLEDALASWQKNAFFFARFCFSYTLIPLLIFLILFHYTASGTLLDGSESAETPQNSDPVEPVLVKGPESAQQQQTSDSSNDDQDPPTPTSRTRAQLARSQSAPARIPKRRGLRFRRKQVRSMEVVHEGTELDNGEIPRLHTA